MLRSSQIGTDIQINRSLKFYSHRKWHRTVDPSVLIEIIERKNQFYIHRLY